MKLRDVINGQQLVSLLNESSTAIALGLVDQRTGEATRVEITADMVALPDEALLFVEAHGFAIKTQDVSDEADLTEWWAQGDVVTDGEVPQVFTRAEPEPTWMVTPDGREFDLRAHEGGLF